MNEKEAKMAAMDGAAAVALQEFSDMWSQFTDEERTGASRVIEWLHDHYRTAGYKRLLSRGIFKAALR